MKALRLGTMLLCVLSQTSFLRAEVKGLDGNELLSMCEGVNQLRDQTQSAMTVQNSYCLGYVNGVMSMATDQATTFEHSPHRSSLPCTPAEGVTTGQAARVVTKYLDSHPERLHLRAYLLVVEAMREAFPCK